MEDEMLMTKPDLLFGRSEVVEMCGQCHDEHKDPEAVEAFRKKWLGRSRPNGRTIRADSICTDCHGTHNIVKSAVGKGEKEGAAEWVSLFNGRDLTGWKAKGKASWTVEGGRLIGRAKGGGGDLWAESIYDDYLLTLTFRAKWPVRAGIWLRGWYSDMGPRVEIFESAKPEAFTGSVLVPGKGLALANHDKELVDKGGWNTVSVRVEGSLIQVWLNGEQVGAVRTVGPVQGRIGLHIERQRGHKEAALEISEVLIQALGKSDKAVGIFNGKDLTGWETSGGAKWVVEDGAIVGMQGENNASGDLFTSETYEDFELEVTYKVEWPCNSGVWFRYQSAQKAYQADILEYKKPVCYSGTLYCTGKMFLAMNEDKGLVDREGWNTMKVRAEGEHIQIWLNGHEVADVRDDTSDSGRIGFQVHAGDHFGRMKIIVREVLVERL
jgi:hypothetical protein